MSSSDTHAPHPHSQGSLAATYIHTYVLICSAFVALVGYPSTATVSTHGSLLCFQPVSGHCPWSPEYCRWPIAYCLLLQSSRVFMSLRAPSTFSPARRKSFSFNSSAKFGKLEKSNLPFGSISCRAALLPMSYCLLAITYYISPSAHRRVPIAYCRLPIADSPLPDCLLPIAHCRSPMPYNLLPTGLLYCSCICS